MQKVRTGFATGPLLQRYPQIFQPLDFAELQSRTTLPQPDEPLPKCFDLEHYASSYVSIVAETEMSKGRNRRITEKSVKPFLFGHLAILAANPHSLPLIRDLGFATFHPVIDESYDSIEDPVERLCAVLAEIDRLRALPSRELHAAFIELEERRRANLIYGRDVLAHRLQSEARAAVAKLALDAKRVSTGLERQP